MTQYNDRKNALKTLKEIDTRLDKYLIIHYACDDFKESQTITSIAIRTLQNEQSISFSLQQSADQMSLSIPNIDAESLKLIEKDMLAQYFLFVKSHPKKIWIHWNMSNNNFGFQALEERYVILGGTPEPIDPDNVINLSHLFIKLYGKGYAKHPRLENLMKKNNISSPNDFLQGYSSNPEIFTEVQAFKNGQYKLIQLSCLRKVDIFNNFLTLAINNKLKTFSPFFEPYGVTLKGMWATLNEKLWFKFVLFFLTFFAGYFLEKLLDCFFK